MRIPQFLLKSLAVSLIMVGCNNTDELQTSGVAQDASTNQVNKSEVALKLIDLMKNNEFKNSTFRLLEKQAPSVSMTKILDAAPTSLEQTANFKALEAQATDLERKANLEEAPDKIEILEVWMHNPKGNQDFSNLLFSFAPEGDENKWSAVKAYNMKKEVVYLDPKKAPSQPVIVIETNGFETLKKEVEHMNKYLREEGVQNMRFANGKPNLDARAAENAGLETTKLDKIRLNNDEEPWISGAAEVYAITSGIKDAGNKPEIKVIPMYYLDYDGTDYYPNQILLFWNDYKYQAANIQLFEKDDNVNYKSLVSTIVSGVFQIIGTVSTQPWVNVLGQVAGAIIQAMPDQWYTNNDDYVDSFYTIEKNKRYTNHYGARGNAKVNLSPFFVAAN